MVSEITNQRDLGKYYARLLSKSLSSILIVAFINFSLAPVLANPANRPQSFVQQNKLLKGLHRLDFRLEGKSCAACLLTVQRKLNSLPGVKEAVVMLKRPYGVSVVYQIGEIKQDEILAIVKDKEPNVKVLEVNDVSIASAPSLLIPPFVPLTENQQ